MSTVSWLAYPLQGVPGLSNVRIVRVLRTVRVFKRIDSMRLMLTAISAAVVPVTSAFFLMFLFTSIYAVLAVDLYKSRSPQYFGKFSSSFFTMFQMLTGDEWSTVTRETFSSEGEMDHRVALFFCSYIVGAGIILMNIVVAVLLDEFIKAVEVREVVAAQQQQQQTHLSVHLQHIGSRKRLPREKRLKETSPEMARRAR